MVLKIEKSLAPKHMIYEVQIDVKTMQCTVCKQYDLAAIIIIRLGITFIFVMFGVVFSLVVSYLCYFCIIYSVVLVTKNTTDFLNVFILCALLSETVGRALSYIDFNFSRRRIFSHV